MHLRPSPTTGSSAFASIFHAQMSVIGCIQVCVKSMYVHFCAWLCGQRHSTVCPEDFKMVGVGWKWERTAEVRQMCTWRISEVHYFIIVPLLHLCQALWPKSCTPSVDGTVLYTAFITSLLRLFLFWADGLSRVSGVLQYNLCSNNTPSSHFTQKNMSVMTDVD